MHESAPWLSGFKADYERVFVEPWSPYLGAILLVMVVLGLMISGLFWGVFGGLKLWGDWFNSAIGLGDALKINAELDSPLIHRMSLMDITLLSGAFAAALMSRQFGISRAPRLEYVWGALGGTLMGIGATLAGGCTTGGFFTPALHSSPTAWMMALGLMAGAVIGLKLLLWTLDNISWGMQAPVSSEPTSRNLYPLFGVLIVAGILAWTHVWAYSADAKLASRAIIVIAGFAIGFIMHRSRLCFARAFREPFMTAEGDMTKALILALAIGIPLASLLFQKKMIDPYIAIPARFWAGSLFGGMIFGVGMIFAGGCASGSLWRAAEGNLKLWVTLVFFAWSGSSFTGLMHRWEVTTTDVNLEGLEFTRIGVQSYLPDMLAGWNWTYLLGFGILLLWYLFVRYNESTEKFTVL
ncbi:MAG: YeeE/YedE family protein [Burkholderiales bacterium]|nr:YeeE/YedE family protein [Burkholderiales bacterium]